MKKAKRRFRKPIQRKTRPPLWLGPILDGITFSLLSKFLVCRHRFWLKVIEGLKEDEGFNHALEFGSMWHEGEEAHAAGKDWKKPMARFRDQLRREHLNAETEITKTFLIATHTFPLYVDYWRKHPDEKRRKPILEEVSFRVPYKLPSGRVIILRGKWDCVFRLGKSLKLQENKTKGKIDDKGIQATVDQNLQTMLYQIALRTLVDEMREKIKNHHAFVYPAELMPLMQAVAEGCSVRGVLYNVVRRPLSDNFAIKQRKGRVVNKKDAKGKSIMGKNGKPIKITKGTESDAQFYNRMAKGIKENPGHSFMRWNVTLSTSDVDKFKMKVFHPIVEGLLDWWEWIEPDPHNPWRMPSKLEKSTYQPERTIALGIPGGGIHYQTPWGVYNNIFGGFRGDFFDLLTTGRRSNTIQATTLFPEL